MDKKLRCLVVDDESLARKLVIENIRQIPFLECVSSCKNPFEAMDILQQESIDLMFLDIQMPGMLGTNFLASLRDPPMVILITAYSNYAVESYDLEVIDYLVKPVSIERFTKAAFKAMDKWRTTNNLLASNTSSLPTNTSHDLGHFFVNVEYALVKVIIQEITHIESMKDYIKIFLSTATKPILTKSTLKGIEKQLPSSHFMRIHRSFIVHINKIETIRNRQITIGSYEIPISENNLKTLLERLEV